MGSDESLKIDLTDHVRGELGRLAAESGRTPEELKGMALNFLLRAQKGPEERKEIMGKIDAAQIERNKVAKIDPELFAKLDINL